jgi:hypothetical protein
VTPHTFRRTYITYAIAAGFDIPYVQAQVGHSDPNVTLAVYAQVMRRPDRDQLRSEIRAPLGVQASADASDARPTRAAVAATPLRTREKAGKGRALSL